MKLKIARSQKTTGMVSKSVMFQLDARAEFTQEEEALIQKYKIGPQIVYSSESFKRANDTLRAYAGGVGGHLSGTISMAMTRLALKVTIDDLKKGVHLELKDLSEAIGAEEAIISGCKAAKEFIDAAEVFDGREEIVDIDSLE